MSILVGFTAGGAFDITARLMGRWLSEQFHSITSSARPRSVSLRWGRALETITEI